MPVTECLLLSPQTDPELHRIGGVWVTEISSLTPVRPGHGNDLSAENTRARKAAMALEASFLSEMLKAAGFGTQVSTFSGGAGEDQFASFHREAIAERMVRAGGIGLAEHFFNAMTEKTDGT
ncbi:rod-binding protein [Roseovarius sp.]|uniref:rod-binding protein n=1 Tax=Roseovarius sp. TaxID=1486281 RepID=UPI003BAA1443